MAVEEEQQEITGAVRNVGALDRPGQAAQSLLTGNLPAAWRSMFQPGDLSLPERDAFLHKLGLDKPPFDTIFRTLTNPLLIISLALSHKFPVPVAQNIFKLSEKVGSLTSRFPVLGRFTSMQALFRGTNVPDDIGNVVKFKHDFLRKYNMEYSSSIQKFEAVTGKLPSQREQVMISAWLDGLHKGVKGYEGINGKIRVGSGSTMKLLDGVNALFPKLEQQMGGPLLQLAKDTRAVLDAQWSEVFTNVEGRKRILQAIKAQKGLGVSDDVSDVMNEFLKNPRKIADYFPHRVLQTEDDFRAMVSALTEAASAKRFAKSATRKTLSFAGPEVHQRKLGMTPATEDLNIIGDLMDATEKAKLDSIVKAKLIHKARAAGMNTRSVERLDSIPLNKLLNEYPGTLQTQEARMFSGVISEHMPSEYSLKLMPVVNSYTNTLSSTFAWTVKGQGEKIMASLKELKGLAKAGNPQAKARADMLENTYIPTAMGRGTFRQSLKAQSWDHSMVQLGAFMEEPKIKSFLGDSLTKTLQDGLAGSRNALSFSNISRKTAGYFYLSTLGLNPGAALKNTMQLILTTGPTIGFKTTAEGLNRAFQKSHKYFALRLGPRALKHEEALIKAYPEFGKAGLAAAPITDEVISNTLLNAYDISKLPSGGTATLSEKIQRSMMSMFTASETTVRLATFEAGMLHAQRARMGVDDSIVFAKKLVEQTQFLTGPQNTPFFLIDKAPTTRQLMQFPFRFLEFATSTAFTLGSGGFDKNGNPANILGRWNPGTFARMIAGSIITMELGEAIGVNAGDALLGGALPTFTPLGKVGAPLPVVPPLFQILGAGGAGLASGDFTELMKSTPLLVPGGVQLFKTMGLLPPGIPGSDLGQRAAQIFERNYADYKQPSPDGRVAVFSGKGTLRGYYRPWEIVRYGIGIKGGDLDKEQETLNFLVKNRENIRQERASYLDARFRNDARGANKIARAFQTRFGFSMPVNEKDMRAMQLRRKITRLEQVVRTLPPGPARDQMVQVIATTMGAEGQDLLGIDPAILGASSAQREGGRFRGSGSGFSGNRFQARTDLSPNDEINPSKIGRQPGANQAQSPF